MSCKFGIKGLPPNVRYNREAVEKLNEQLVVYSTLNGRVGLVDTRCPLGGNIDSCTVLATEPRVNITSLCHMRTLPGHIVFLGTAHGHVMSIDLRCNKRYLHEQQLPHDGKISRMREIIVLDGSAKNKTFLAYTNESAELQIYDADTMKRDTRWICDRRPEKIIRDFG